MTNKFTSKVSYTDALTVVTYKQPKLSIDVTDILQGSDVPVTLLDNDEPIPAGTAEVLWSEDKVNWVQEIQLTLWLQLIPYRLRFMPGCVTLIPMNWQRSLHGRKRLLGWQPQNPSAFLSR